MIGFPKIWDSDGSLAEQATSFLRQYSKNLSRAGGCRRFSTELVSTQTPSPLFADIGGGHAASVALAGARRPARYLTPSASVCSSCIVPAATVQESPGPYVQRSAPKTSVIDPSSTSSRASNSWACDPRCTFGSISP